VFRTIRDGTRTIEFVSRDEARLWSGPRVRRDTAALVSLLRRLATDPLNLPTLRETLADLSSCIGIDRLTDHEVLERVAREVSSGRLELRLRERVVTGGSGSDSSADSTPAPPEDVPENVTHWIEFQVVADDTGQPVPNVKLRVNLPTGHSGVYTTGADGVVRIDGVPAGACEIAAVMDEDALEVVRLE
jgi:hypothetical protein